MTVTKKFQPLFIVNVNCALDLERDQEPPEMSQIGKATTS